MRALIICSLLLLPAAGALGQQTDIDPRIAKIIAEVSEQQLQSKLATLASFQTRHTLSSPDPAGKGIGAARQWIFDEMMRSSPRLQVSFDSYRVPPQGDRIKSEIEIRNVMAVLPGRSPRRVYVSAHYDSRTVDVMAADAPAPGANDDGSGTVLTMELARLFGESGVEFDATLVFIALAGEEQGLVGASLHVQRAAADKQPIEAVLNNDIVGGAVGGSGIGNGEVLRVFSDGPEDSPSRQLARHTRKVAARYVPSHKVELIARYDRFGRGGDHTAFNQRGFAAVRLTEANENYAKQHSGNDTLDGVSFPYLAQNVRVNAAALATLALAPPAPSTRNERGAPTLSREPSGYDAKLVWQASPWAGGYRIYWRATWAPDWEHTMAVGNVTEYVLRNISIDDYVFGVAALGADGSESLVSAYVNPPRQDILIKTIP